MTGAFVLGLALIAAQPALDGSFRASLGLELDTNARRAVSGARTSVLGRVSDVVGDGLGRAFVDASGRVRWGRDHLLRLGLTLGAKQFWQQRTEDLVAQNAELASFHRLGAGWSLSSSVRGRVSRIRSGSRDYDLASGGLAVTFAPGVLDLSVHGLVSGFGFAPESNYDHLGPSVAGEVGWRPAERLRISATVGRAWRFYGGNGLVIAQPVGGSMLGPTLTFCDDPEALRERGLICTSRRREDEDWQAGLQARYDGDFIIEGAYRLRSQRSSSSLENVDRHRIFASATVPLPWRVDLGLVASLQINEGASVSDAIQLAEADENQNSIRVKLLRPVSREVDVEIRWSLFASQFGSEGTESFLRQTAFVGLAVHDSTLE